MSMRIESGFNSDHLEIVFVELGRLPKYSILNIRRTKELFPNIGIVLITDKSNERSCVQLKETGICKVVEPFAIQNPKMGLESAMKGKNGEDNFWLLTISRLFQVIEYHKQSPRKAILHVESDVILMPNFPWEKLCKQKRLAWGKYSRTHDVAALMFFPNSVESEFLRFQLVHHLSRNPSLTDMKVLSEISSEFQDRVLILPTAIKKLQGEMQIEENCSKSEYERISENDILFNGIFDVAAIGMWISGKDPSHTFGVTTNLTTDIFKTGQSFINLRSIKFRYLNDEFKLELGKNMYNLYSLHIHSKKLKWFRLNSADFKATVISKVNDGIASKDFSFHVLFNIIKKNARQGSLIRLASHLPWVKSARRRISKV